MPDSIPFVRQAPPSEGRMERLSLPLFPLHSVLFPGGPLPLRVFETRYLDMISECLKANTGIGICLIRTGSEVGEAAETYEVGTLSRITYWNQRPDGLLGVTVRGEQRFRILSSEVRPNKLIVAEVELLANEPELALPESYRPLARLLENIVEQLGHPYVKMPKRYDEAGWVGARLTELLPFRLDQKQYLLQLDDPLLRLERLTAILQELEIS